jgi:phosphoserine phosphatase RsbU/P
VSDNFVTAFYGIFDPRTGAFIYANAGHNAPYVISDSSVKQLIGGRSVPLGILTNEMLNTMNKRFSNDTVVLEKDTKLVLYTDGLIEARHYKDDSILFEEVIEEELMKQSSFPSKEFIERLFSSLVIFNGSSNFEDDVCIICVDV